MSVVFLRSLSVALSLLVLTSGNSVAQNAGSGVTYQDILAGLTRPDQWPTFSGDYSGQRHSPLTQITPENVHDLVSSWTFQTGWAFLLGVSPRLA